MPQAKQAVRMSMMYQWFRSTAAPPLIGSDSLAGNSALVIDGSSTHHLLLNYGGDGRLNAAEDGSVAIVGWHHHDWM